MFPADGSPVKPYDAPDSAVFPRNQRDQHCSTWNKRRAVANGCVERCSTWNTSGGAPAQSRPPPVINCSLAISPVPAGHHLRNVERGCSKRGMPESATGLRGTGELQKPSGTTRPDACG
jgi:hypothetical protein